MDGKEQCTCDFNHNITEKESEATTDGSIAFRFGTFRVVQLAQYRSCTLPFPQSSNCEVAPNLYCAPTITPQGKREVGGNVVAELYATAIRGTVSAKTDRESIRLIRLRIIVPLRLFYVFLLRTLTAPSPTLTVKFTLSACSTPYPSPTPSSALVPERAWWVGENNPD